MRASAGALWQRTPSSTIHLTAGVDWHETGGSQKKKCRRYSLPPRIRAWKSFGGRRFASDSREPTLQKAGRSFDRTTTNQSTAAVRFAGAVGAPEVGLLLPLVSGCG